MFLSGDEHLDVVEDRCPEEAVAVSAHVSVVGVGHLQLCDSSLYELVKAVFVSEPLQLSWCSDVKLCVLELSSHC